MKRVAGVVGFYFALMTVLVAFPLFANSVSIGPYDKDVKYTVWATDKNKMRVGDPIKEGIPLSKGKHDNVFCGTDFDCSLKTTDPEIGVPIGVANSFDLIGTTAPNVTGPLDDVLFSLAGFDEVIFPSIYDTGAVDNLVGFIDMRVYIESGTTFTFDPN